MKAAEILLVEDEPKLAQLLSDYLVAEGYEVQWIANGDDARNLLEVRTFAAVLLDLTLPGTDGLEVCKALRTYSDTPVLMITARIEEVDRLVGLEIGADDYICKPFSPREVVARVKAVLRRARLAKSPQEGPLELDVHAYVATFFGIKLELTPVEFRLLQALATVPGRVLSRDQLLSRIHADGRYVLDRSVDSHVRNLRRKLELVQPEARPIRSVYGVGYAWEL